MVTYSNFILDHILPKHQRIEAGAETLFVSQHESSVAIKYHTINTILNVAQLEEFHQHAIEQVAILSKDGGSSIFLKISNNPISFSSGQMNF